MAELTALPSQVFRITLPSAMTPQDILHGGYPEDLWQQEGYPPTGQRGCDTLHSVTYQPLQHDNTWQHM